MRRYLTREGARARVGRNQIGTWTRSTGSRAWPPPSATTRRSSATSTVRIYPAFSCFSLHSVTSREAIHPGTDLRVLVGGLVADVPGMGTEEVEMEMEDDGDMEMEMEMALELGDATWPEVACPYCYEDHDVASLCVHLEEDHPYEPPAAVSQSSARFLLQDSYYREWIVNLRRDALASSSDWIWRKRCSLLLEALT